ncbi:MAG TPA: glycosyltransferase [Thermoanaerobaculia bacterium]|nr:glycosyltransferase [Thermoanaerobaculia bacterium]
MLHGALIVSVAAGAAGLAFVFVNEWLIPRLARGGAAPGPRPRVSIVIPARNEERDVEAGVRSHLAQDYGNFEVVVVEDRSTDATPRILERLSREDSRLRVVPGAELPEGWLGKPHALAQGAALSGGELILFADADVRYHPRALSEAVTYFAARKLDFLMLIPQFEMRGFWENVLMPYLLVAFFQAPSFLANWQRPRWIAAGGGAGNLVRRTVYEGVGGHRALADSVVDDVRLAFAVKGAGYRVGLVRADDRIAVRMYRGFREVFDGFTKNFAYVYQGLAGLLLLGITVLTLGTGLLPAGALVADLVGLSLPSADVVLAAVACGLAVFSRVVLAVSYSEPLWPALTHPIMAAVWSGILLRSLFQRFVRRRLTWRGRTFAARRARF